MRRPFHQVFTTPTRNRLVASATPTSPSVVGTNLVLTSPQRNASSSSSAAQNQETQLSPSNNHNNNQDQTPPSSSKKTKSLASNSAQKQCHQSSARRRLSLFNQPPELQEQERQPEFPTFAEAEQQEQESDFNENVIYGQNFENDNNNNNIQQHHFQTMGDWVLIPSATKTHYASMCFDASKRVVPGRSTLSPTVEMNHPAISPPLLRAQFLEENSSSSAPIDVVRQLAQEQYEINLQRAQQDSQEQHVWDQVTMMMQKTKINNNINNNQMGNNNNNNDVVERTATVGLSGGELVREKLQQILLMGSNRGASSSSSPTSYSAVTNNSNSKSSGSSNYSAGATTASSSSSSNINITSSSGRQLSMKPSVSETPNNKMNSPPSNNKKQPSPSPKQSRQLQQQDVNFKRTAISSDFDNMNENSSSSSVAIQQQQNKIPSNNKKVTGNSNSPSSPEKKPNEKLQQYLASSKIVSRADEEKQKILSNGKSSSASSSTAATLVGNVDEENSWIEQGDAYKIQWNEWDENVLKRAQRENKMLFVRVFAAKHQQQIHEQKDDENFDPHAPPTPPSTVTNTIVRKSTGESIDANFIPVLLDWHTDAELCETYHQFLKNSFDFTTGDQLAEVRQDHLVSEPEVGEDFDVFLTGEGAPIIAYASHMVDYTENRYVLGDDRDGWRIPMTTLNFTINHLAKNWHRRGGHALISNIARGSQQELARVKNIPRRHVSRKFLIDSAASLAIDDFCFLLERDPAMTWKDLTSKPSAFVNGLVPLFVDAQQSFLEHAHSQNGSPTEKQFEQLFEKTLELCKAGENEAEKQPLDALAEAAWLTLLIRRELAERKNFFGNLVADDDDNISTTSTSSLLNDNKWIITLKQRLLSRHLSKRDNNTISRAEASSAALVKVVRTLAAHASVLASSNKNNNQQQLSELKTTLRLSIWITDLMFERARTAKSSRTVSIDSVHAWCALLHLMRCVGYDPKFCSEILQGCSEGLVEALRPLHRAWEARAKLSTVQERAQRALGRRTLLKLNVGGGAGFNPYQMNPFSKKRHEQVVELRRTKSLRHHNRSSISSSSTSSSSSLMMKNNKMNGGDYEKDFATSNNNNDHNNNNQRPPRIATTRTSSSWFALAPLIEEEIDFDDAFSLMAETVLSSSSTSGGNSQNIVLVPSPAAARSSAISHDNVTTLPEVEERAWMSKILALAVSLPIGIRDDLLTSNNFSSSFSIHNTDKSNDQKEEETTSEKEDEKQNLRKNKPLWKAANLVWAGAPRVDRSETLSNALRALDLLCHTTLKLNNNNINNDEHEEDSNNTNSHKLFAFESPTQRKQFVNLYFSLRQLSALMLTAQSRKNGDCLALHGQLIGTALTASTSPTFALLSPSSSPSEEETELNLLDFGAVVDRKLNNSSSSASALDKTVNKFLQYFSQNPQVCSAVAETTCLSLASQVITVVSKDSDEKNNGALSLFEMKKKEYVATTQKQNQKSKNNTVSNTNGKKNQKEVDLDYVNEEVDKESSVLSNEQKLVASLLKANEINNNNLVVFRGSHHCQTGRSLWEKVHFQYESFYGNELLKKQHSPSDDISSSSSSIIEAEPTSTVAVEDENNDEHDDE